MMGDPSRGEAAAWKQLRMLRAEGFAFRREHEIGEYRADFVCLRRRLIVEVDGGVHDLLGRAERDAKRDAWLTAEGFKVMRFRDSEVLSEANWLQRVREALQAQPDAPYRWKTAPVRTLPLEGGGQGGGESVEPDASDTEEYDENSNTEALLTPPPTPSPSRGGG
ncbi:MAG: endonuclease domain-containing protein [Terricaulis sp.]